MPNNKYKGLVIVESPAKAKKIGGFLGKDYKVLASMGHVRDLPKGRKEVPAALKKEAWADLGVNTDSDFEPIYIVSKDKKSIIKELKDALKQSGELILATDEDREGESIGWHLKELLSPKVPVSRMVFDEITRDAILAAMQNRRQLDENLVEAQETRRVLDRLYGYTISPLLWKKIKGNLSAGRVQSVAVRLVVRRELERLAFKSATYWDLKAELKTAKDATFEAMMATVAGVRVASGKDFDENTGKLKEGVVDGRDVVLLSEEQAKDWQSRLQSGDWTVSEIKERTETRKPYAPFTTSTLQQESNRRYGWGARDTMRTAQRLYEEGYITYMRTDSTHLSKEAIDASRGCVTSRYGNDYLSDSPRQFTSKSKNAQEAHEAIRPAGTEMKTADELNLSGRESTLYDLIWKRTVATQMAEARLIFTNATMTAKNGDREAEFRASGRRVAFPGFFRAYVEGSDDPDAAIEDRDSLLPAMSEGDALGCEKLDALSHETKPPARYTEASLVKALEENGVGRPSTYASIIGTIQNRDYVKKQGRQLCPTFTAMAVTRLLEDHFPRLVDIEFTARMEQILDDISNGEADRSEYLSGFYRGDDGLEGQVKTKEGSIDPREACTLQLDGITPSVRVGRYGPFFEAIEEGGNVTASIPEDIPPADLDEAQAQELIARKKEGPKSLGIHPEENEPVFVLEGPFGPYVQMGEVTEENPKPKRVSIPNNVDKANLSLDQAVVLLSLPRRIGHHPETDKVVNAGIGRFGPYVLHDKKYASFDKKTHTVESPTGVVQSVLDVTMDTAVEMLKKTKSRGSEPIATLGDHPEDGKPVEVHEGRYGPYVKHKRTFASVPKDLDPKEVKLEQALEWLAEKAAVKKTKKKSAKKSPAKSTKKKAAKKKKQAAKKKSPAK